MRPSLFLPYRNYDAFPLLPASKPLAEPTLTPLFQQSLGNTGAKQGWGGITPAFSICVSRKSSLSLSLLQRGLVAVGSRGRASSQSEQLEDLLQVFRFVLLTEPRVL